MNKLDPEKWMDAYSQQLFAYASVRVNNRELAKDLVQDTFLSALAAKATYRGELSERNWLYLILKNKIVDFYRKQAKQGITELDELLNKASDFFEVDGHWRSERVPGAWDRGQLEKIETQEFYKILTLCKQKLHDLQKAVFTLKYLEEKTTEEICKELNISASNYWVLIHRAKLQLRACLEKNWFTTT